MCGGGCPSPPRAPPPTSAERAHPLPRRNAEQRPPAEKRKVSVAQSDAKILQELFGGGYLEIRPCEGPRVQIRPRGRRRRHRQRRPVPRGREGRPRRKPGTSLADSRQVGPPSFWLLMPFSLQNFFPRGPPGTGGGTWAVGGGRRALAGRARRESAAGTAGWRAAPRAPSAPAAGLRGVQPGKALQDGLGRSAVLRWGESCFTFKP